MRVKILVPLILALWIASFVCGYAWRGADEVTLDSIASDVMGRGVQGCGINVISGHSLPQEQQEFRAALTAWVHGAQRQGATDVAVQMRPGAGEVVGVAAVEVCK